MWNIEAQSAEVKHSRRESRSAVGAEGGEVWGGGVPLPTGGEVWEGGSAPLPENLLTLDLQMVNFGAFLWFFFQFSCLFYTEKPVLLGFQNLPLQFTVVFQADDND